MRTVIITLIILLIALVGLLGYRYGAPKAGMVVVSKTWLDSLKTVAESLPDTVVKYDTVYPPPKVITITKEVPVPVSSGDEWAYYEDEHKDEWVHISVKDSIQNNRVTWREWEYELFVPLHIIHREYITQKIPLPYPVKERVKYVGYVGADMGTDGWRIRGGKYFGAWAVGPYVGQHDKRFAVGVSASYNF